MARQLIATLRFAAEVIFRPYAQVVFAGNMVSGVLVALAIATYPRVAAATLLAVGVAVALSWLFGLDSASIRAGGAGCTAILTTLATLAFHPGGGNTIVLVLLGAALAVLFYASFESVFASVALPTHALPFIAAAWSVHLASRSLPASGMALSWLEPWSGLPASVFSRSWLDIPASLVFLSGSIAGALVLLAIALHSRIALILAFLGAAVAFGMRALLRADAPISALDTYAIFNAVLTAMAIGGVWFVPQPSSLLLASGSAAVSVAIAYALFPAAGALSLPVLSLPFVVTTHLVLTAARRRQHDRRPRSTTPDERPEEALIRHLMWIRRYGDAAWLPFRLPFRGEWVVTQGYNGLHTHKGPWRHGLDFEILNDSGKPFQGDGNELRNYGCYGLPVVAAGAGTVVKIIDGIADNRPGDVNTSDNWGNAVVLAHGPSLYSVYAHLQPRSIRVKQGDFVSAGGELGRCGNSGRALVPHLHFQVQQTPLLGSPTLAVDFGDVVSRAAGAYSLANRIVPMEGATVRAVIRDEALARALAFLPGEEFLLSEKATGKKEKVRVDVDLLGRRSLRSDTAALVVDPYESALVFVDFRGNPRSLLRYLLVGIARVPFDQASRLTWQDSLSRRLLLPSWVRPWADLLTVAVPDVASIAVDYHYERADGNLVVRGQARSWTTTAAISLGNGNHRFEIVHGRKRDCMEMRRIDPKSEASG